MKIAESLINNKLQESSPKLGDKYIFKDEPNKVYTVSKAGLRKSDNRLGSDEVYVTTPGSIGFDVTIDFLNKNAKLQEDASTKDSPTYTHYCVGGNTILGGYTSQDEASKACSSVSDSKVMTREECMLIQLNPMDNSSWGSDGQSLAESTGMNTKQVLSVLKTLGVDPGKNFEDIPVQDNVWVINSFQIAPPASMPLFIESGTCIVQAAQMEKNGVHFITIIIDYKYRHFGGGSNGKTIRLQSTDGGKTFNLS